MYVYMYLILKMYFLASLTTFCNIFFALKKKKKNPPPKKKKILKIYTVKTCFLGTENKETCLKTVIIFYNST